MYNEAKEDAPAMLRTSGSVAESKRLSQRPSVSEDITAHLYPTKVCGKRSAEYPHTPESFI
jgi:hypothetical protein